MDFDYRHIKKLLKLMEDHNLAEISVTQGEHGVTLKKPTAAMPGTMMPMMAPAAGQALPAAPDLKAVAATPLEDKGVQIVAPMVGTFYRSSSPEGAPFVNVGDYIEVGQVLCILEAMKLMNEFKSEISGKILKILVENGEAVEFGRPLFVVEK